MSDIALCKCSKPITWAGVGRPPSKCADCRNVSQEARDGWVPLAASLQTVQERRQQSRATNWRKRNKDSAEKAKLSADVQAARLIAIALRTTDDPEQAAKLAGVDPEEFDDFDSIVDHALSESMRKLRDGDRATTAATVGAAMQLGAERIYGAIGSIDPQQLPGVMVMLNKMADQLGGFRKSYTKISVSFDACEAQTHMMHTLRRIAETDLNATQARQIAQKCLDDIRLGVIPSGSGGAE